MNILRNGTSGYALGVASNSTMIREWSDVCSGGKTFDNHFSGHEVHLIPVMSGTLVGSQIISVSSYAMERISIFFDVRSKITALSSRGR